MTIPVKANTSSSHALQYIVGSDGQPTAVILDINTWQQVVDALTTGSQSSLQQAIDQLNLRQSELKGVDTSKDPIKDKEEEKARFIAQTFGILRDDDVQIWPEGPFETRESIE